MRGSRGRKAGEASRRGSGGRAALTLAVFASLAALTLAGAWGLQTVTLAAPTRASRVATGVVTWLVRYRLVESEIHLAGRPVVHGVCLSGWLPAPTRVGVDRGVLLELDDGTTLQAIHRGVLVLAAGHAEPPLLQIVQLQLAGCTRTLAARLGARLRSGDGIRIVEGRGADSGLLAVHVRAPRTRLTLLVDARTYEPRGVRVRARGYVGWSRVRITPLVPGRLGEILTRAGLRPETP